MRTTECVVLLFLILVVLESLLLAQTAAGDASEGYFTVLDQRIHCKAYKPSGRVLLLHGAAFSSENWKDINTLNELQTAGIFAFAIDLPGFGKSQDAEVDDRGFFLKKVVDYLDGDIKVVVSPSMSGSFSIPFINTYGDEIDGFVPVAPVSVNSLAPSRRTGKRLSVFAVSGSRDTSGIANLPFFNETFVNYSQFIIEDAGHPAYLDNPDLFNSRLLDFVFSLISD